METARWVCAVILALFAVGVVAANWILVIRGIRGQPSGSQVPLIGGLAGAASLFVVPSDGVLWWWIPLVLDPGSVPLLFVTATYHIWRLFSGQN